MPTYWGYSTNPDIEFELDEHTCYACQHKDEEEGKLKKDDAGVTRTVRAKHADKDGVLPGRADFYARMQAEHERKMAELEEDD